jgi:hypothetical protein
VVIYPQSKLILTKMKKKTSRSLRATGAAGNVAPGQCRPSRPVGKIEYSVEYCAQDMIFLKLINMGFIQITWNIKYVWTL